MDNKNEEKLNEIDTKKNIHDVESFSFIEKVKENKKENNKVGKKDEISNMSNNNKGDNIEKTDTIDNINDSNTNNKKYNDNDNDNLFQYENNINNNKDNSFTNDIIINNGNENNIDEQNEQNNIENNNSNNNIINDNDQRNNEYEELSRSSGEINNNNISSRSSQKEEIKSLKSLNHNNGDILNINNENNNNNNLIENNDSNIIDDNKNNKINYDKLDITNEIKKLTNYSYQYFKDEKNFILPNIDIMNNYPLIIINFNEKENLIKKINNNKAITIDIKEEKKLKLFVEKKYIQEKVIEIRKYFKKSKSSPSFYNFINIFGNTGFLGFKNNPIYDKKSFNKNNNENFKKDENGLELIDERNIGKIEHFVNLLYKYKKYENIEDKENENISELDYIVNILKQFDINFNNNNIIKKDVLFYRKLFNDGNSFFRGFIFALIEDYIIEKNIYDFNRLIKLLKLIYEKYSNIIDYNGVIFILEKILYHLKIDAIYKAFKLLYQSFLLNNLIIDSLIFFVKLILCFIKYGKIDSFDYKLMEFELYDIILLYNIFDISLEISFNIKFGKNEFLLFDSNNKRKNKPIISLCFYKNNCFIYYNIDKYYKLIEYNIIKPYENIPKINKIIYEFEKKENCEICQCPTIHIALIEKSIRLCKNCLNKYIENIIENRLKSLIKNISKKDIFFSNINFNKKYFLENYEYLYLFNDTIIDSIQKKFIDYINKNNIWFCAQCKKFIENVKKLECGCAYCIKCLNQIINKMTNGYMVLNPYEKKYIGKIRCKCGDNMDILSIIEEEEEKNNKNKEKNDSMIKRFNEYIETLCMNCEIKVANKNNGKIKILDNKNKNITPNHILCKKCYEIIIKEQIKNEIFCKICSINHRIMN